MGEEHSSLELFKNETWHLLFPLTLPNVKLLNRVFVSQYEVVNGDT